jgi:hypothetical protein
MALDSARVETLARDVVTAMERDHGGDQDLTAAVTIAATRRPDGEVYIRCLAADGDGLPLAPWHLKGILRYLVDELPD